MVETHQQTDLFVWVVEHRDERRNAFQAPHVRLDLGGTDKETGVHAVVRKAGQNFHQPPAEVGRDHEPQDGSWARWLRGQRLPPVM